MAAKKPCTVKGIEYESGVVAAKALGISLQTLENRLRSPNFPEYTSKYHAKFDRKPQGYPCTINRVEYETIKAAADALGIDSSSLRERLRSSNFPEYISRRHSKVARKSTKRPCTINGIYYESETAAAKALNIPGSRTIHVRLTSYNFPEYVSDYKTKASRQKRFVRCSVAGAEYASLAHASRRLGIADHEMRKRLASTDYPNYVCADIPKPTPEPPKYTVRGKPYKSVQEIANVEGVTRERIRQKMHDPSFPDYISADNPKRPLPPPKYMVRDKPYKTIREIADIEGVKSTETRQRMGSTPYPDYVGSRIPKKPPKPPQYRFKGKYYNSLQEIDDLEGITADRVRHRMNNPSYPEYQRLQERF